MRGVWPPDRGPNVPENHADVALDARLVRLCEKSHDVIEPRRGEVLSDGAVLRRSANEAELTKLLE